MFSRAVSAGTRLYDWKMKPSCDLRNRVRCFSLSPVMSSSPRWMLPESTVSRPAIACMSVDFPEPEGPMMAVNRPRPISRLAPSSARTVVGPVP
jgi:hypothetical protein